MVDFLRNWILNIVTVIVFLLLIEIMIPSGNIRKFVNLVAGFILLVTIIKPVTQVFREDMRFSTAFYTDTSFLDRNEIMFRSKNLEEQQLVQLIEVYRGKLVKRIEESVLLFEGVGKVKADVIINEDYSSGNFGEVKRVYLELVPGDHENNGSITVEKITVGDEKASYNDPEVKAMIGKVREKVSRIMNTDEEDVVISVMSVQEGY